MEMTTNQTSTETRSYHHVVVDVPHLVDVHGDLSSAAVAPRGAGRRQWTLSWLAAWGELKVGAVWLPVNTQPMDESWSRGRLFIKLTKHKRVT